MCHSLVAVAVLSYVTAGVAAQASACAAHKEAITTVAARGATNYEFGFNVGRATALRIAARMRGPEYVSVAAFGKGDAGAPFVTRLLVNANDTFPLYVDELRGMADGAGIAFADIFILNAMSELERVMPSPPSSNSRGPAAVDLGAAEQCTTILVGPPIASGGPRLLVHNEDARPVELDLMYLLEGRLPRAVGTGNPLQFTAFMYAGALATGAFGFNNNGVVFSTNALSPLELNMSGVPRTFLQRHLLEARSAQDAVGRLQTVPVACGFSANIAALGGNGGNPALLFNVELSPTLPAAVTTVGANGVFYHTNSYITSPTAQNPSPSSAARLSRLAQLPVPSPGNAEAAELMLGDTLNATYPVYRSATLPDRSMTVMSATFELTENARGVGVGTLSLRANNPHLCREPILTRAFDMSQAE